jgi:DNA repair protein RecO
MRESDLLVELLTQSHGRTTVCARGALRSRKRYMGALERGTILKVDYRMKRGLSTLGPCDILSSIWRARHHLEALASLYYILEILRLSTPFEDPDEWLFFSTIQLIEDIEHKEGISVEDLVRWELTLMTRLGYQLKIDRCPYTNRPPDGLSLLAGGSLSSYAGKPYHPLSTRAQRVLYQIQRRHQEAQFSLEDADQVRQALGGVWGEIIGTPLRSLSFFENIKFDDLIELSVPSLGQHL